MIKNKISIVILSYNQVNFLEETINSVINQNYDNTECIIVDGGSMDGSRELILKYKDKIKIIFQEKNTGPADALNVGFKNATGHIFGYINSDDFILKDSLIKVNIIFNEDPDLDLIFGNGIIVDENSFFKKRMISRSFNLNKYKYGRSLICQQSTFFKKKVFDEVKGFNAENNRSWDFELFADIYKSKFNVKKINDTYGAFREYPLSITGSSDKSLSIKNHERLFIKYFNRKKNIYDKLISKFFYFMDRLLNPIVLFNRISDLIKSRKNIKVD